MERSGGVTAAGVVLLVGSTILLLIALATAFAIPYIASKAPAAQYTPGAFVAATIFYLALAGWGVGTAVGLFRLRPWARISILSMSVLALVIGIISAVSVFILLPHMPDQQGAHTMAAVRGILVASFGFPMAIAAWWLVLFLRPGVRQPAGRARYAVGALSDVPEPHDAYSHNGAGHLGFWVGRDSFQPRGPGRKPRSGSRTVANEALGTHRSDSLF
jgi:hypothetical protein